MIEEWFEINHQNYKLGRMSQICMNVEILEGTGKAESFSIKALDIFKEKMILEEIE